MKRRPLVALLLITANICVMASPLPYDESADARAQVQQGLEYARKANVNVLVIFGANWCEDCRALDTAMNSPRMADLLNRQFKVVKVDVGRFDRNLDLAANLGGAVRKGIPAAVILAPSGHVLFVTRGGELADARRMSETGIYDFFNQAIQFTKNGR